MQFLRKLSIKLSQNFRDLQIIKNWPRLLVGHYTLYTYTKPRFSMPPDSKTPKTRSRLSDAQRKEICEYAAKNQNAKHHEIAEEFKKRYSTLQLDRSTVSKILKKSEQYMNLPEESVSANRFRHKPVKYPTLELAMSVWVQQITAGGMPLSDQLLREKGADFARALEINEKSLSFSSGWVTKFNFAKLHSMEKQRVLHSSLCLTPEHDCNPFIKI